MGRAEREAEFAEHLKSGQEEGFPASEPERKLWGSPGIFLLNFGGRGGGWDLRSNRYVASNLNLPFENAKCVYPVNNLRKNIHLKEDIH